MFQATQYEIAGTPDSIPELIHLNYDIWRLQLRLDFSELSTPLYLSMSCEGFRVLDERELLEYWDPKTRAKGWLWRIESGGWFDPVFVKVVVVSLMQPTHLNRVS